MGMYGIRTRLGGLFGFELCGLAHEEIGVIIA
jgi:hypothetical protein